VPGRYIASACAYDADGDISCPHTPARLREKRFSARLCHYYQKFTTFSSSARKICSFHRSVTRLKRPDNCFSLAA